MSLDVSTSIVVATRIQRGIDHFKAHQFAHAVAAYDSALQLSPDDPYARWNRAMALLSMGDYARGFPEHDVAWRLFHWRGFSRIDTDRIKHLPLWHGERTTRLLVYHELGFGDAIMAMRYLPELKLRAGVTLVIDPALVTLARPFGIEVTDQLPDSLSGFDYRLPFFGVMSALKATAETIPRQPYIFCRDNCPTKPHAIGIAWSGRTQTAFTLSYFLSLLAHHGFTLHALQPGEVSEGVEPFPAHGNFSDVADRIAQMAHIVTVDTAAAHLAGAMGHPSAHLVLPHLSDWRWWHSEIWYPRLRTYRQDNETNWSAPFARLNEVLHGQA